MDQEKQSDTLLQGKRLLTLTLGCKVNQYETDGMRELLERAGCETVDNSQPADICLVNTCSVTNMAERKSRQMIHRVKKQNPQAIVVAAGCYVQTLPEQVLDDLAVDLIIGNNCKHNIADILTNYLENQIKTTENHENKINKDSMQKESNSFSALLSMDQLCEYEELPLTHMTEHTRAYIKIQDGCNQFCSYCIIPYVRGRIRSRKPEDILAEVQRLAVLGCKEVVLTGIHISSYGLDRCDEGMALLSLIHAISKIDGIERIRLGSLEPRIITDTFASELVKYPKLCPHFHLSLQSGCNETLRRMNRKYTIEEYRESCRILRRYYDRPALTTDVIVGFPGETEEEFQITCRNLEELDLYEMHVFKYSRRRGTVADRLPDQVPEQEKNRRSDILLALTARQKQAYEESFRGEMVTVLVEERENKVEQNSKDWYSGHTERYIRVEIASDQDIRNQMITTQF